MNFKKYLPLIFVLIFNLWLIKIINHNIYIGIVSILSTLFIYLSIQTGNKKYLNISIIFITVLLIFQYKTSSINSLTFLNESEKLAQRQRMRGYPQNLYRFANWLEQRKEALIFYKIEENFSEVMDPNIYFFANHPRERIGVVEYEKFPYILFPFFIIGILMVNKSNLKILLLSMSPLILLSLIGNSNTIGPFSLFPFLSVYITMGLEKMFINKKHLILFFLFFSLVFIQTISYATY